MLKCMSRFNMNTYPYVHEFGDAEDVGCKAGLLVPHFTLLIHL